MKSTSIVFIIMVTIVCGALHALAKEPKTVITGDQMQILKSGKKVVFSGNSRVTRGESTLNADELVQDKESDRVDAAGNIAFRSFTQDRELVEGRSDKGFYRPGSGIGELWGGRPEVIYHVKNATGPVVVQADRITFNEKQQEIAAAGQVDIVSSSATAHAPYADFRQNERKVVLTGSAPQPELIYRGEDQKGKYKADKITLFVDQHKVLLEGNVNGTVDVKELDKKR